MEESRMKVVVLLRGGMDSVCALYYSSEKYEVISALSFDYGSNHNMRELPHASFHCKKLGIPHTIIKTSFVDDHFDSSLLKSGGYTQKGAYAEKSLQKTIIPFRNGIILSIAAGYAESRGINGVVTGAHSGDYSVYPDCREKFLKLMSQAVCAGTYNKIRIIRPFVFMTKDQIVKKGRDLGVDFSKSWSCDEDTDVHCGECGTCVSRREAFSSARVSDPTDYTIKDPLPLAPID